MYRVQFMEQRPAYRAGCALEIALTIMNRSPDIDQLSAFFGGSHVQVYPDSPAEYNTHRFECVVGEERIVCEMLPAEYEFRFTSWQGGKLALDLKLQGVQSLDISRSAGDDTLIGNVDAGDLQQLFKLQVRPKICLEWSSASSFR